METKLTEGRDAGGRFVKGHAGGPGNPHSQKVQQLRTALLAAVSPEDLVEVVKALITNAKAGDVFAARELLDRCLGKAKQPSLTACRWRRTTTWRCCRSVCGDEGIKRAMLVLNRPQGAGGL